MGQGKSTTLNTIASTIKGEYVYTERNGWTFKSPQEIDVITDENILNKMKTLEQLKIENSKIKEEKDIAEKEIINSLIKYKEKETSVSNLEKEREKLNSELFKLKEELSKKVEINKNNIEGVEKNEKSVDVNALISEKEDKIDKYKGEISNLVGINRQLEEKVIVSNLIFLFHFTYNLFFFEKLDFTQ